MSLSQIQTTGKRGGGEKSVEDSDPLVSSRFSSERHAPSRFNVERFNTVDLREQVAQLASSEKGSKFGAKASHALRNDSSIFARISGSDKFQVVTMSAILLNALWLGIDTQWNSKKEKKADGSLPLEPTSIVIENLFCTFFSIELIIRFLAFRRKLDFIRDLWFLFDLVLVIFMVLDTWLLPLVLLIAGDDGASGPFSNLSVLRLLRLLRLTRMVRVMDAFPELLTLVQGILRATKAVFFIVLFLVLVTYVFAIVFTSQLGDPGTPDVPHGGDPTGKQMFATLGDSFMSLFTHGVLGDDLVQAIDAIVKEHVMYFWLFMLFMFICSMTLLNMLIGVLCEVVASTSAEQGEEAKLSELRQCLDTAFAHLDMNGDGCITDLEWSQIQESPEVRHAFMKIGFEECELEERLGLLQLAIFSTMPGDDGDTDAYKAAHGAMPHRRRAQHERGQAHRQDEVLEQIQDFRPSEAASLMALEVMKLQVKSGENSVAKVMESAEAHLEKALERRGWSRSDVKKTASQVAKHELDTMRRRRFKQPGCSPWLHGSPLPSPRASSHERCEKATSRKMVAWGSEAPQQPAVPPGIPLPETFAIESPSGYAEANIEHGEAVAEELCSEGKSPSLQCVPTEVLLLALRSRHSSVEVCDAAWHGNAEPSNYSEIRDVSNSCNESSITEEFDHWVQNDRSQVSPLSLFEPEAPLYKVPALTSTEEEV